jgi:hypothetical protein
MTEERQMKDGVQYTRHFTSMGDRPAVRKLIDELIAEGFEFDRASTTWFKPGAVNEQPEQRGRISASEDGTRAWLQAPSSLKDGIPYAGPSFHEEQL